MSKAKTKIDWPGLDYTWNVVTGCRNTCKYCVVRNRVWPRIKRLYGNYPYNELHFHPDRIDEPNLIKKPSKWFVGFYSDIACWVRAALSLVYSKCHQYNWHTFMFLTKNPFGYLTDLWKYELPKNTMQGATITCDFDYETQIFFIDEIVKYPRPFISIEPILGNLQVKIQSDAVELVIVGAMTGAGAIKPEKEWIQSIRDNVPADKIYWKKNIRKYL